MYDPTELASFAVSEFQRGLEGLTEEEALRRFPKEDGSEMNSISWTVQHLAAHWGAIEAIFNEAEIAEDELRRSFGRTADPQPPPLKDALNRFRETTGGISDWVVPDDDLMTRKVEPFGLGEDAGQSLIRVIFHTWFHAGEVNAIRQLLGHPEIIFVGLGPPSPPTWNPTS